ncbi:MAG: class I SAM-dependent RNA methyltransferase [Lentisphaerae bacterium]|nr:class I SAM-dependent RNA methyltransferase [Lentisphaerota bacterium]
MSRLPTGSGRGLPAVEPLAHLDYAAELAVKNAALREFWEREGLPLTPDEVAPAPRPRHYRTTTRRHVVVSRGRMQLLADPGGDRPGRPGGLAASALEPTEHAALYNAIAERLREPHFRPLSEALHFVILRGSLTERCLILNVSHLDGVVVRKLRILAEGLPEGDRGLVSAFIFHDPTRSPYYLDTGAVPGSLKVKKLFGPEILMVSFNGRRYSYAPTGFTQVNEAMVPELLATARRLLAPGGGERLLDLYCGYGLFAHDLAADYAAVHGLDAAPEGIESARRNGHFLGTEVRASFRVCRIDGADVTRSLPKPDGRREVILADPPRQGIPPAALAALAERAPARVVQACCGTDEMPAQIRAWQQHGYRLQAVCPLDMFPGTAHLETFIRLEPAG